MYTKYTPAIPLFVSNTSHEIFFALVVLENQVNFLLKPGSALDGASRFRLGDCGKSLYQIKLGIGGATGSRH